MKSAGYINLPEWHDFLLQFLIELGYKELTRLPVLGRESIEKPWVAMDADDFMSVIDTGILFAGSCTPEWFPERIITSDPQIAIERILNDSFKKVFFSGAIGSSFAFLNVLSSFVSSPKVKRIIVQNDSVAGLILSKMERENKSLSDAITASQWEEAAPGNPTNHIHGIVTRNRLLLQMVKVFGVIVKPEQIETSGFGTIDEKDVGLARELGFSVRLLGMAQLEQEHIQALVEPCMIPSAYFLAQVRGGSEIVYAQMANDTAQVYACPGTSKETIVRGVLDDLFGCDKPNNTSPVVMSCKNGFKDRFYIKMVLPDLNDTLAKVLNILNHNSVSVEKLVQPTSKVPYETIVILTEPTMRENVKSALFEISEKVRLASAVTSMRIIGR